MNSTRRTSERAHGQIELDLELRDSSELDAQPPFSIVKALAYGQERSRGLRRTTPEAECGDAEANSCRHMLNFSDSREPTPEVRMHAVLNGTPSAPGLSDEVAD
jgi:hypothetical protein